MLSDRYCFTTRCPYSTIQFNSPTVCCSITHLYSTSLPNANHAFAHNSYQHFIVYMCLGSYAESFAQQCLIPIVTSPLWDIVASVLNSSSQYLLITVHFCSSATVGWFSQCTFSTLPPLDQRHFSTVNFILCCSQVSFIVLRCCFKTFLSTIF